FVHSPLDDYQPSIRVGELLPWVSAERLIQCRVRQTTNQTTYTCISYRWDAADVLREIHMNDKVFLVRQNLYDLLEVLQQEAKDKPEERFIYWIDALCIDQNNIWERNHQVAQMGRIFSTATCV
ncbi:hypothetical protein EK21DRAFT_15212, partial [Setomelanomma holmii]